MGFIIIAIIAFIFGAFMAFATDHNDDDDWWKSEL